MQYLYLINQAILQEDVPNAKQFVVFCREADELNFNRLKSNYLPPRKHNAHKGDFGHVLIIGGAPGMLGAARLAAEAALRVGAGLVSVATHETHAYLISAQRPEIMSHGITAPEQLLELLEKASVVVIGMGLGKQKWGRNILDVVLQINEKPLLLDADALNILSEKKIVMKKNNWILTPHPGEAARMLNMKTEMVQENRIDAIKKLQNQWGGICILKGEGTLIKGNEDRISLCVQGNPGMASGGMGDLLSGVIGGLLAQHIPAKEAAELGVCLHAQAADMAALEKGERGLLAMDLMPYLQALVK